MEKRSTGSIKGSIGDKNVSLNNWNSNHDYSTSKKRLRHQRNMETFKASSLAKLEPQAKMSQR